MVDIGGIITLTKKTQGFPISMYTFRFLLVLFFLLEVFSGRVFTKFEQTYQNVILYLKYSVVITPSEQCKKNQTINFFGLIFFAIDLTIGLKKCFSFICNLNKTFFFIMLLDFG